jgi:DNA-binding Lrp family transcriptional regulator
MPLIGISIYGAYQIYNAVKSLICKLRGVEQDPARKTKTDEIFDLINPVNAFAEVVAIICELCGCDEETVQKIRMWLRIIFGIILAIAITIATWGAGAPVAIVVLMGVINASAAILHGVYTYLSLKKQEDVAKKRLKLETAIAYCEKLQKDLDIIASEIDMIVELFTASMDRIRAEYDRISRMIKETSDVKNMIARNIGA